MADDVTPDWYKPPSGDSGTPDWYKAPSEIGSVADVGKSLVSGVGKGFTGLAGLAGDIAGLFPEKWRDAPEKRLPTSKMVQEKTEEYTGKFYEPQTTIGKYAHTIGEFAPAVVGSPTGLAARALRYAVVPGVATEAAGQAAQKYVPELEPYVRAGTALATGIPGAFGMRKALANHLDYRGSPTANELHNSVDARYGALRDSGATMNPTTVSKGVGQVKKEIDVHPDNAEKTFAVLNRIEKEHAPISQEMAPTAEQRAGLAPLAEKEPVSFDKIYAARRDLNDVWKTAKLEGKGDGPEARAARQAIGGLDDLIGSVFPGAQKAREEAAAAFRTDAISNLFERAENTAKAGTTSLERAYKTELKSFIQPSRTGKRLSPAEKEGFTKAEIDEIRQASKIGSLPHMLRALGIAGGHLGWAAGAGYWAAHGFDPTVLALNALGTSARVGHGLLMRSRADRLARLAAARSPLGVEAGAQPSRFAAPTSRLPAIGVGSFAVRNAAGFKKGGRVTRTFWVKA